MITLYEFLLLLLLALNAIVFIVKLVIENRKLSEDKRMKQILKRFVRLSLYNNEHSDSPGHYNKEWLKYEYLDPYEKAVVGSEEDYENFKKYISE